MFLNILDATEAEAMMAGLILIYGNEALREAAETLLPKHFGKPLFAAAYEAALELDADGKVIDLASVYGKVKHIPNAKKTLMQTCEMASVRTATRQHAKRIIDSWRLRTAYERAASFGTGDVEEAEGYILSFAEDLRRIVQEDAGSEITDWQDATLKAKNEMFAPVGDKRINLGFSGCDKMIGGIDPTDYVLIAARPSVGKSAFATNIVMNLASRGRKVLFISLEMPKQQIVERMTAAKGGVKLSEIRSRVAAQGQGSDCEKDKIEGAIRDMRTWDIDIHDSGQMTPNRLQRIMSRKAYDVAIIDHIGLMQADGKPATREQEISQISRALRMTAMRTSTQVIALSQLNRAIEARGAKRVQLSDLRDSGSLEQDATLVIGLSPAEQEGQWKETHITLDILKNRNGRCGTQTLAFLGEYMLFWEVETRYDEPRRISGL